MRTAFKALIMSAAVAATVMVPLASAEARDWHHRRWHHHDNDNGDAIAAGVLGLAAGALIGGAIASDPGPRYYEPAPPAYYPPPPPRVVYREYRPVRERVYVVGSVEPWSAAWYDYCERTYRSFNPSTGTSRGYDGQDHFCTAN
jgi:hypothetical protein